MSRDEQNEAIAKILGFEKYGIRVNGIPNAQYAWRYPVEYRYLETVSPMYDLPDFIGMIAKLKYIKELL